MNTQPQNFSFNDTLIRVITDEQGNPWFVAKDICSALDLSDVSKAVSRLDEDEKGTNKILTLGGSQDVLIINESGLYSLILSSNKPEAKAFKKVVTNEILPSIRKTGQYSTKSKKQSNVHDVFLKSHRVARELFQDPQQRLNYALQYTRQQTGVDLLVEAGIQQTDLFLEGAK
jgi:prophage antirepressor-like protein